MKMIKLLFPIFLLLISFSGYSQVKVTSYSVHSLGVSVPINEKFSAELKVFANRGSLENTSIELNSTYKFKPGEFHQFSAGLGFGLIPYSGEDAFFSVPVALEIFPLQSFKRLSLVVELAPEIYFNDDVVALRHLWGIRYSFSK
ncbi:hypothetical protein [Draconibacterium sediminis]|mgnify:CR=1 FL=1|uniref:hypothetical protein n=1 Tax=Draconibacterium sediminis TaxID=1544798 RepID=UPI0026ED15AC|nr:hypothetical protein [Draconibacterium sediminis]